MSRRFDLLRVRLVALAVALAIGGIGEAVARAGSITVTFPKEIKVKEVTATNEATKTDRAGTLEGQQAKIERLDEPAIYDLRLKLMDGTLLQGVNMAWHNEEPPNLSAGPMTDDDQIEIRKIVTDVKAFTNINKVLQLKGDHDRAIALVWLVRDKDFVNDAGGEIVWRLEIWYFKFQYGGWEKVSQMNKVLNRQRFKSRQEFNDATANVKYVPEIGGLLIDKSSPALSVTLPAGAGQPATAPKSSQDDEP